MPAQSSPGWSTARIRWTPQMDAQLKTLRRRGLGKHRCAARMGVAHTVIMKRVRELGLPDLHPGSDKAQRDGRMLAAKNGGASISDIAAAWGLSPRTVDHALRRARSRTQAEAG